MTASDRDQRHRWAETCERIADNLQHWFDRTDEAADLREIAAYLRDEGKSDIIATCQGVYNSEGLWITDHPEDSVPPAPKEER